MKTIALALLAAMLSAQPAAAVNLPADGRGQVLLFPYYTVHGGYDTVITLVNTSGSTALKLRFREGRNGRPVLDLDLYLSMDDAWSAVLTRNAAGDPVLRVFDTSCTVPLLADSPTVPGAREIALNNTAYSGYDRAGSGLDRAREGYVEVIEMGEINYSISLPTPQGGEMPFGSAVSSPSDCAAVAQAWAAGGVFLSSGGAELRAPRGRLIGSGTLLNVTQGTDYSYDPVVLDKVRSTAVHTAPGSANPSLEDAAPNSLVVVDGVATTSNWNSGIDAVSAVLMRRLVLNEYVTAAELDAGTDWVLTFPTKPHLVARESKRTTATRAPFTAKFDDLEPPGPQAAGGLLVDGTSTGACEPIGISRRGRNGETDRLDIPLTPFEFLEELCWTANVLSLRDVLQSNNRLDFGANLYKSDGWMSVDLWSNPLDSTEGHRYGGLPVIGFAVVKYANGNVGGVLSNYGGAFAHRYETWIER